MPLFHPIFRATLQSFFYTGLTAFREYLPYQFDPECQTIFLYRWIEPVLPPSSALPVGALILHPFLFYRPIPVLFLLLPLRQCVSVLRFLPAVSSLLPAH